MEAVGRLRRQGWDYTLELSCMELYNNGLRDLLAAAPTATAQSSNSSGGGGVGVGGRGGAVTTDMNAIKHDAAGERAADCS
jgi:hypothetical protein